MKNVTKLMISFLAVVAFGTACSKNPGFKKDKQGFYYKFYIENKENTQPQMGDIVDMTLSMRLKDSVLYENIPFSEMIIESLYPGDLFASFQKLHIGDSATFIVDGENFFRYFWGQDYPFESNDLYFDIKLNDIVSKEEFEALQTERAIQYETMIEELRISEDSLITDYITKNKIKVKPTNDGLYIIKNFSGTGKSIKTGSTVAVHYTGKLLDGSVFDSYVDYGRDPIEVTVGSGQVIQGWEKALLLMRSGDKAIVLIPSKLAYGSRGIDYVIPPYTPLIFDMEVVSVE